MKPALSVLMSAYNAAPYLRSALDSLQRQTEREFECLILDDGSCDGTWPILQTYARNDARIRLWRKEKNEGLTRALSFLLSEAQGTYIARQDADDLSEEDRFHQQKSYLDHHGDVALVGTAYSIIDEAGTLLDTVVPPSEPAELDRLLPSRNALPHGSWMARTENLRGAGGYRVPFPYAQDYDLLLRLIERYKVACLENPLYHLRLDAGSLTLNKRSLQRFYADLARRCHQRRKKGLSDAPLLETAVPLESSNGRNPQEGAFLLQLFKTLHCLKGGHLSAARAAIHQVPWFFQPSRSIPLRVLSYSPLFLRRWLLRKPHARGFLA